MDDQRSGSIEIAPLQSQGSLYGFVVSGRWPEDMVEWSKVLILAVQLAAVPGLVPTTTVYRVREDKPDLTPTAVGLVVAEGSLIGEDALQPGQFAGLVFSLGGPVDGHHDVVRFTWHLGPAGEEPIVVGFDVAELDAEDRITAVHGFLDKVPAGV